MRDDHTLNLNLRKVIRCLRGVLPPQDLKKIEHELHSNVKQMRLLALSHLRAAARASGHGAWRQRVSRCYYACYHASRAVRLAVYGHFDQEVGDHKKVGNLPGDFPDGGQWANDLTMLRGDRNLSDYDHTESKRALEKTPEEYLRLTKAFLGSVTT